MMLEFISLRLHEAWGGSKLQGGLMLCLVGEVMEEVTRPQLCVPMSLFSNLDSTSFELCDLRKIILINSNPQFLPLLDGNNISYIANVLGIFQILYVKKK